MARPPKRDATQPVPTPSLADRLDAALPQTQCTRCGYPDCRAYADAMAHGRADIDRCPPGGAEGIARLAGITGRPVRALNPACGIEAPRLQAVIDEASCIGCTRCLPPCPVDCIVGLPKALHTVIGALCTGCALCAPACPVDCIAMVDASAPRAGWSAWSTRLAATARERYAAHLSRHPRASVLQSAGTGIGAGPAADAGDDRASHPMALTSPAGAPHAEPVAPVQPASGVPATFDAAAAADDRHRRVAAALALARARAVRVGPGD